MTLRVETLDKTLTSDRRQMADFLALTKPRLVLMVLIATLAGFYLGSFGEFDWIRLLNTIFGTALAAGGTIALNQYVERDLDAKMRRTKSRPLPDGRLHPAGALIFGIAISAGGVLHLLVAVNALSSLLAALTVLSYIFLYTPMKRKTPFCTFVGAIPGALPPMGGWVAAQGSLGFEAWVLFGIMFFWQIPHSLAIAWMYRTDYERAGLKLLPVIHPDGRSTGHQIVSNCLALLAVGLVPTLIGIAGPSYFIAALALGSVFLGCGVSFAILRSTVAARRLLLASYLYIPLQLGMLSIDKVQY
ncbi:MAG: heme o synthase [Candidatus Latescibacterota bacterium]